MSEKSAWFRQRRHRRHCYFTRKLILTVSCAVAALLAGVYCAGEFSGAQKTKMSAVIYQMQMDRPVTRVPGKSAPVITQVPEIFFVQKEPQSAETEFFSTDLTEALKAQITGISYPDTDRPIQISYSDLAYVHVLHYDFNGQVQEGEIICNRAIAQDLVEIFYSLYENCYPIEKISLIDRYNGDDEASMQDNNTSCFNYRTVPGKTSLSNHSYGLAIDINPRYNPYVRTSNGTLLISPKNGAAYADRSAEFPYKIDKEDLCYQLFTEHGFQWGGSWNSVKDYQHFEKVK